MLRCWRGHCHTAGRRAGFEIAEERERHSMKRQALFLSVFAAAMLALPAFAAEGAEGMIGVRWGKNAFNFEPMPAGPQPLRDLCRRPDRTAHARQLVGAYHNPILTPEAAAGA